MPEGQSFPERLRALRRSGAEALAPLWIEQLPPEEALAELRGREGGVFRVQEAWFLLELGRSREALGILSAPLALPAGLEGVRRELAARAAAGTPDAVEVPAPAVRLSPAVSRREADASFENALTSWLLSVQGWRRAHGV